VEATRAAQTQAYEAVLHTLLFVSGNFLRCFLRAFLLTLSKTAVVSTVYFAHIGKNAR